MELVYRIFPNWIKALESLQLHLYSIAEAHIYEMQVAMIEDKCREKSSNDDWMHPVAVPASFFKGGGPKKVKNVCKPCTNLSFKCWNCQIWTNSSTINYLGGANWGQKYFGGAMSLVVLQMNATLSTVNHCQQQQRQMYK